MTSNENYSTNFFKPGSEHAKSNNKLIFTLALIWAIAVFGFHFLLIIVTTPTAEDTLKDFESVWPQVVEDTAATNEMNQQFSKSLLMVLGKNIALKDDHKFVLKEALSWAVYDMQSDSLKGLYLTEPGDEAISQAASSIGLGDEGFDKIMKDLLPNSLVKVQNTSLSASIKESLPGIMELYLIHNQSFLTDFRFLGFPFHYWYTAQFLLILFVVLCLIYAVSIDKINTKHAVPE